ncbi:MAG: hypothetical protein JKY93_12420 [Gammaproteobacteria bacterium]|nr:hypothetical protein [Gammaproteobacteria bacterium]
MNKKQATTFLILALVGLALASIRAQAAEYIDPTSATADLAMTVTLIRSCGTAEDAIDHCESGALPECCAQIEPASGEEKEKVME